MPMEKNLKSLGINQITISEYEWLGKQHLLLIDLHQDTWASVFGTVSGDLFKLGALSVDFVKFGMYLQQRLWTPLIFFGASAAAMPALDYWINYTFDLGIDKAKQVPISMK